MVRQLIKELVWVESSGAHFEAGDSGTEKTTVGELREYAYLDTENKTQEQLEATIAEAETAIWDADIARRAALKRLAPETEQDEFAYLDGLDTEALSYAIGTASQVIREQAGIIAECSKRLYRMQP